MKLLAAPRLLILAILVFFQISCSRPANESICLIPKNFTGVVLIIFDQSEGVQPSIENGKYVYKIPISGILRTRAKANKNVLKHE